MGLFNRSSNDADETLPNEGDSTTFLHTNGQNDSWSTQYDETQAFGGYDSRLNSEIPMVGMNEDLRYGATSTFDANQTAYMGNNGTADFPGVNASSKTQVYNAAATSPNGTLGGGYFSASHIAEGNGGSGRNVKRTVLIVLCVLVGILAVAYIGMSIFFMSHFGFNTQIGGIDCSFKSVDEVTSLIETGAKSYELTIYERTADEATQVASASSSTASSSSSSTGSDSSSSSDSASSQGTTTTTSADSTSSSSSTATTGVTGSHTETIAGSSVDFAYKGGSAEVQSLLDSQNAFAWVARLFAKDDGSATLTFEYDQTKLQEHMKTLACMDNTNAVAPKDAYPEFNGTNYVVHNEVPGNTVDTEKAQQAIVDALTHGEPELDLSSAGCYFSPSVLSNNADLQERVKLLDKYVPFALTYTFTDGSTELLDGATIFDWLTINDDGSYTVDDDQISSWVEDFASRHNTVGHERTFTSVDGNTYTVSGGTYGWSVDQDAEIESIKSMLESKQSETREPHWATQAASSDATGTQPDWGSTYIDLNLTAQHVYYVKDGQKVFEADVVTGMPTAERQTPAGVYYVMEKMRNKTLKGEMTAAGVPEYETPVSYWMRMTNSGVGFHDATWQSSFGGDAYKTRGSHGCINMSMSDVAELYDLVETGCPIVSHY